MSQDNQKLKFVACCRVCWWRLLEDTGAQNGGGWIGEEAQPAAVIASKLVGEGQLGKLLVDLKFGT